MRGDPYVEELRRRAVPLVTIGKQFGGSPDLSAVDLRSSHTAQLLIDHLRSTGCRKIALMTGSTRRNAYVETEDVYTMLARSHGMEPVIVRVDEAGGEAAAFEATCRLMREHAEIDGLFASVDTFAAGSLRALQSLGIAVPGRVRLATRYDGIRARETDPPMTAVNLRLDAIAADAITLLLEQLQSKAPGRLLSAPEPELVVRRSTREPPSN